MNQHRFNIKLKTMSRFTYSLMTSRFISLFLITLLIIGGMGIGTYILASSTTQFQQTINPGTLTTDIVDSSYNSVANPSVTMNPVTFSFSCQTATGTFGTSSQQIYVQNPDAADDGWTLTVAPANTTDYWDGSSSDFDFNDGSGSGCSDGSDADSLAGQMTIDPSGATLSTGQCSSCTTSNISKGSSTAFEEGTTDSVTLLTASASSDDIGDWTLQGVSISQTIPAEQPAESYTINMVLTVTAF